MDSRFFDINKFPKDWGIIVFPISMSRIGNTQSPATCIEALEFFLNKIEAHKVGANFIYSEGLYMNFEKDAYKTKNKFAQMAVAHMGGIRNLIAKSGHKFQIDNAFSFESWFQIYLSHKDFFNAFVGVKKFYDADERFRQAVAEDAREQEKDLTEEQLSFYLEEHTFEYLLINRELTLQNDFVNDRERWILNVYPGKPARASVYLYQKDPLYLNEDSNSYKGQYDLAARKFIDYRKVDLNHFEY